MYVLLDAELKECFILFDPTGRGVIASENLGNALRAMGQNPSQSDVSALLKNAVVDGINIYHLVYCSVPTESVVTS